MSIPKYIIYECDVCKRQTEIALDPRRPDPQNCNITLKCRGRLHRIGQTSSRKFLFTPPVVGLQDYVPRGTVITPSVSIPDEPSISIFTANGSGMLTLAGFRRETTTVETYYVLDDTSQRFDVSIDPLGSGPSGGSITLQLFELTPEILSFKRYTYLVPNSVQRVRGPDNSAESLVLRFNLSNKIRVFVNGIELSSAQFDRSVNDQITFTPAIFDTNNVIDVLVYNDLDSVIDPNNLIPIIFKPIGALLQGDLDTRKLTCWGDYSSVVLDGTERAYLFCQNLILLDPDKSYGVAWANVSSGLSTDVKKINPTELLMLMGREPFAFRDKDLHAYVSGTDLITNQGVLTYQVSQASGLLTLTVSSLLVTQVFAPLQPTLPVTNIAAASAGSLLQTAQGSEELKRNFIIGPS